MVSARARRTRLITQIGIGQTIGYASSYYLPAVLAPAISDELGISYTTFYLLISLATVVSVVLGPRIGRWIDSTETHRALPLSTFFFAAGLVGMAFSPSAWWFIGSWVVLSFGTALGLYEVAFATVVRLEPDKPRQTIAGVTLIAGFASSIGWPLTAFLDDAFGWRIALMLWAASHLVINLPLYLSLPGVARRRVRDHATTRGPARRRVRIDSGVVLFGLMLAMGGFVQGAMGLHLIPVLEASAVAPETALWAATLLGPGQVFARLLQLVLPGVFVPKLITFLSLTLHIVASALLFVFGAPFAAVFSFIHGMGSGFYTVSIGTLPLEMYGADNYGERQGYILGISRAVTIATPYAFSFAVVGLGELSLLVTSVSCVIGLLLFGFILIRFRDSQTASLADADPATVETGPIDVPDEKDLR